MPRRDNLPKRSVARRHAIPRTLVVCGGKTEEIYFNGLRTERKAPIRVKHKVDSPDHLVRYAKNLLDQHREQFDEAWCVVDKDEFDIGRAVQAARTTRIGLAVSNPCFEFWLLLHFSNPCGPAVNCREVTGYLCKFLPAYDKTKINFAHFDCGVEDAVVRAERIDPTGLGYTINPSTGVWKLVRGLLG